LAVSLLYLLFRRALAVAALRLRSSEFKELEIVVLTRLGRTQPKANGLRISIT
jgi:hypothetical protein